jgi:hypothetical protein
VGNPYEDAKRNSPENLAITATVISIARDWQSGAFPLASVREQCSGTDRWVAINHAKDDDRKIIQSLLDALVDEQDRAEGVIVTKQGRFTQRDLREAGAWIHPDEYGNRIIRFKGLDGSVFDKDTRAVFRPIPDHKIREGQRIAEKRTRR